MAFRIIAALAAALILAGSPGAGAQEEQQECGGWFPDFRCGRSGRFEGFHKPIASPYLFEDPFIVTGAWAYYGLHRFPNKSALGGGEAHVAALQLRVALTDRLDLIATKDGRMWLKPDLALLDHSKGWMDIAAGLKYALIQDRERNFIVSGVLRFEFDSGTSDVFQDQGDGIVIPSISAAWGTGNLHLMGDVGGQIPIDGNDNSDQIFWHAYADYNVIPHFAPFVQVSGLHWVGSGNGEMPVPLNIGVKLPLDTVQTVLGTGPFEGADVMNFGSRGASGLDLITVAVGAHVPITDHVTLSAAYERSVTHYEGIFDDRFQAAVNLEF